MIENKDGDPARRLAPGTFNGMPLEITVVTACPAEYKCH